MQLFLDVVLFVRNHTVSMGLSTMERLAIFTLAGRIGFNEFTWISQKELAKEMNISQRYLIQTINSLIAKNIIKVTRDWKNNRYQLTLDKANIPTHKDHYLTREKDDQVSSQVNCSSHDNFSQVNPSSLDAISESEGQKSLAARTTIELQPVVGQTRYRIKANKQIKAKGTRKKMSVDNSQSLLKELPDWLPKKDWEDFISHRKAIRKPMSDTAKIRAINELGRLKELGNNVSAVINQSIINGWSGVFACHNLGATSTRQSYGNMGGFARNLPTLDEIKARQEVKAEKPSGLLAEFMAKVK